MARRAKLRAVGIAYSVTSFAILRGKIFPKFRYRILKRSTELLHSLRMVFFSDWDHSRMICEQTIKEEGRVPNLLIEGTDKNGSDNIGDLVAVYVTFRAFLISEGLLSCEY